MCDVTLFGNRRRRALIASAFVAALIIGSHSGLLSFICTHNLDRHHLPPRVDWNDGDKFARPLVIYIFLGFTSYIFQNYLLWLLATFTNDPAVLSRYSGYVEALKSLGLIVAFGIDSHRTAFLTEEITYLTLLLVGTLLCVVSAVLYTRDTEMGDENSAFAPGDSEAQGYSQSRESETSSTEKVQIVTGDK